MERALNPQIPITVEVTVSDGWGGERWDVVNAVDERDGSSLGDIGVYDFDAYSDFPNILKNAVLNVLQGREEFEYEKLFTLHLSVRDGGSQIGEITQAFRGNRLKAGGKVDAGEEKGRTQYMVDPFSDQ